MTRYWCPKGCGKKVHFTNDFFRLGLNKRIGKFKCLECRKIFIKKDLEVYN